MTDDARDGRGRVRPEGRHDLGRVPPLVRATQDFDFDYVLYSNYERQVEDLVAGRIDVAWNSPLAWVRSERLARRRRRRVEALTMRDTDRDLTSVVVVRADSPHPDRGRPRAARRSRPARSTRRRRR